MNNYIVRKIFFASASVFSILLSSCAYPPKDVSKEIDSSLENIEKEYVDTPFEEIVNNCSKATSVQFDDYFNQLVGKYVVWDGNVLNVMKYSDGISIYVNKGSIYTYGILRYRKEVILWAQDLPQVPNLSIGDYVKYSGRIAGIERYSPGYELECSVTLKDWKIIL